MAWGSFLLTSELRRELSLAEQRRTMEDLRSMFLSQTDRDGLQEHQIWKLWVENLELKVAMNRLTDLLVQRGVLTASDVTAIVGELGRIEATGLPPSEPVRSFQYPRNP